MVTNSSSLLRWTAGLLWIGAALLLGRLLAFAFGSALLDQPLDFEETPERLGRGWSLGVSAALLVTAGILLWKAKPHTGRRRIVLLSIAAVTLASIGMIWWVRRTEAFPALADSPNSAIPGHIAWVEPGAPPCVWRIAAAGGEPVQVFCGEGSPEEGGMGADVFGWSPAGELVFSRMGAPDLMLVFVDPETGQETRVVPASWLARDESGPSPRDNGDRLQRGYWWGGAEVLIERDGYPTEPAVRVRGPHDYTVGAQWSPDGQWMLLLDNRDRLMISPADRDDPRVLLEGRPLPGWVGIAWFIDGYPADHALRTQLPSDQQLCTGYRSESLTCVFDYGAYAGDLTDADVRALLLVLDDEYLFAAILGSSPDPAPAALLTASEDHIGALEQLAQVHGVAVPPDPWGNHQIPMLDLPTACRWGTDQVRAQQQLIDAVLPDVTAADLHDALTTVSDDLSERITTLATCDLSAEGLAP